MIADSLPVWSPADIETSARDAIRSISHFNPLLPNIEAVLQAYDASIETVYGIRDHGVFAILCRRRQGRGTKYVVLVDSVHSDRDPEAQYRFTVAEELGHIVLHGALINSLKTETDFLELHKRRDWHRLEAEASRFARAALVPRRELTLKVPEIYAETIDRFGFSTPASLTKRIVSRCATLFNAPAAEVHRRLHELPDDLTTRIQGSCAVRSDYLMSSNQLTSMSPDLASPASQLVLFDKEKPIEH